MNKKTKWGYNTNTIKKMYLNNGGKYTATKLNITTAKLYNWLEYQDWYVAYQKNKRIERAKRDYKIAIVLYLDTCRNVARKCNVSIGRCGIISKELEIGENKGRHLTVDDKYKIARFYANKYDVSLDDIL